jgi:SagB-type dehydrogenase family enzyme
MPPMRKVPEVARMYHLHSSLVRSRTRDLTFDEDRPPFRFRTYPGSQRIDLPGCDLPADRPLCEVLSSRRSVRDFELRPLDLATLGGLLHASFGLRGCRSVGGEWVYDRASPSAGALSPLEVYVATQAVQSLADGLYHYDARAHQLELRQRRLLHPQLADIALGQDVVRTANLVIVISAIFQRTMWKYGERGYRYVWLDAGHLGQNLYLLATALGLGPVSIGGFFDEELNRLLDLPRGEEEAIYLVCIGHPRERPDDAADAPRES